MKASGRRSLRQIAVTFRVSDAEPVSMRALAQLAADKAETSTPDQWYEAHRSVLMHLGFVSDGLTRTAQDFRSHWSSCRMLASVSPCK